MNGCCEGQGGQDSNHYKIVVAKNSMYYMYIAMYSVYLLHKVVWIYYLSEIIIFTVTRTRGVFLAYQGMCLNHNFTSFGGRSGLYVHSPLGPALGPQLGARVWGLPPKTRVRVQRHVTHIGLHAMVTCISTALSHADTSDMQRCART